MKKNINKSKIYMIICICILCVSILGSTFAFYRIELFGINTSTSTQGLDYYINYAKGQDISGAELSFVDSYLEGVSTDVEFWKKDNTYDIYGHIYLDINEIGVNLASSDVLKYTVVNNGNIISEGTFKGRSSGESVLIASNIPLEVSKQLYTVYVWLGEGESVDASMENETVSLTVRCEATMKKKTFIDYITYLYASSNPELITQKDTAGNEVADYYYSYQDDSKTWGLMNDGLKVSPDSKVGATAITNATALTSGSEGNIRYFGPSDKVNNYIYFNCETYPDTNCELWRIIGIVDGKVKLIRNESIGMYSWGNTGIISETEKDDGSNNWKKAILMRLLNPGFDNLEINGSLYWNSGSGTCYSGNAKTCDFTNTGLKNDETRNMISESTWYLGTIYSNLSYPNNIYTIERKESRDDSLIDDQYYLGDSYTIDAKIGLMYPSDYGFGTNLTKCSTRIYRYGVSKDSYACNDTNWLYSGEKEWLIMVRLNASGVWVTPVTDVQYASSPWSYILASRPVLYLDENAVINSGDGSSTNPYRIRVS